MKNVYLTLIFLLALVTMLFSNSPIQQKLNKLDNYNAEFQKTVISPIDTQYFSGSLNISGIKLRFESEEELIVSDGEYIIIHQRGDKEASRTPIGSNSPLQLDSLWAYLEKNFELNEEKLNSGYILSGEMKTPDVSIRRFSIKFDEELNPIEVSWVDFSKYHHHIRFSDINTKPAPFRLFKFDSNGVEIIDIE